MSANSAVLTVLEVTGKAVVRMSGESMLPTLRAGMRLEVEALGAAPMPGDILVFPDGEKLIAHRMVGRTATHVFTAGDAQPHVVETVAREAIAGRVRRDAASAAIGYALAQTRPLRAVGSRARAARVRFSERVKRTALLIEFAEACFADRPHDVRALTELHAEALFEEARERRCFDFVAVHARMPEGTPQHDAIVRHRAALATQQLRIRAAALDAMRRLRIAGIVSVALKGAARAFTQKADESLYPSGDVDVLVPSALGKAAVDALCAAGYEQTGQGDDYSRHHHLAPLRAPNGVPVEIHVALTTANARACATGWRAMRRHFREVSAGDERIRVFDDAGAVKHLLVHSLDELHVRDMLIAADRVRANTAIIPELRAWIGTGETSVRLCGLLSIVCGLAHQALPVTPGARAFARWTIRKSCLPVWLRRYANGYESALTAIAGDLRDALAILLSGVRCTPTRRSPARRAAHVALQIAAIPLICYANGLPAMMTPDSSNAASILKTSRPARADSIP